MRIGWAADCLKKNQAFTNEKWLLSLSARAALKKELLIIVFVDVADLMSIPPATVSKEVSLMNIMVVISPKSTAT